MELGLRGRRAVVTGGSKGIGRAVVAELLAEGAAVAFCARNGDEVKAAEHELAQANPEAPVSGWVTDVTDPDAVQRFVDGAAEGLGGIDILVNNAGAA
ncbi:MAG: 3-oxoacyl-[acyl-carrier protein] reductase, partial [Frankiaceae bacterium]|nr:3-oxoacyl-[acyl-carrier protein] reductase [Frankiaceae bacterium]